MISLSSFKPACWCKSPHLQTLWPRIFKSRYKNSLFPERLELADGDFVDLCWTEKPAGQNKPVVILFHGLEGSINSPYARGMLNAIHKNGWIGVLMHFRGCSDEPNRLDRSYHSGDTGDIRFSLNTLRQRHPQVPLFAIGYSLGGNALLKYLAEQSTACPLTAAIGVSVPFELDRCADKLNQGFSRFYQWYLIKSLREKIRIKFKQRQAPVDLARLNEYRDFWAFDHHITARLHGFKSAKDYYLKSSCRQFLPKITTRCLIIHAKDDPFVPEDAVPNQKELSNGTTLDVSAHGGHVGFISGSSFAKPEYWLEKRIPKFIHDVLTQST